MNKIFKIKWCLFIFLFLARNTYGSYILKKNNYIIQPSFRYGFIVDTYYAYQHLVNDYIKAFHLNIGIQTAGEKDWHQYYLFPETGITFIHYNLSNDEQLGRLTGFIPFLQIKPLNIKFFYPSLNFGIGMAYCSKPYNRLTNHHNVLLGSHLNAVINGEINLNFKINKNLFLNAGISYIHFSNGNTKVPNEGLNILNTSAGLKYLLINKEIKYQEKILFKKYNYSFISAISLTNRREDLYKGFHYYDIIFEFTRNINPVYAIGAGIDIILNDADSTGIYDERYFPGKEIKKGVKLVNQFSFSRLEVLFQIGFEFNDNTKLYDWIILRYRIYKFIKLNISYRSYLLLGDHLSWGLCFTL